MWQTSNLRPYSKMHTSTYYHRRRRRRHVGQLSLVNNNIVVVWASSENTQQNQRCKPFFCIVTLQETKGEPAQLPDNLNV